MTREENDLKLVRQCLDGDEKAFELIVDKYQKTMFNVVLKMINDYDCAEDITQSAFIKVFENLRTFNPRYKFFSWLYRIVVNESLNFFRHKREHEQLDEDFVSDEKTPEETYDEIEKSQNIENALMALKPEYRIAIVLRHFQDLSYTEMSQILDIPEKTVKSRLFTARQLLRDILLRKGTS